MIVYRSQALDPYINIERFRDEFGYINIFNTLKWDIWEYATNKDG
jgi:hypothetical protein